MKRKLNKLAILLVLVVVHLEQVLVLVVFQLMLLLVLVQLVHVTVLTQSNAAPQLSESVLASSKFLSPATRISWTTLSITATMDTLTLIGVTIFTFVTPVIPFVLVLLPVIVVDEQLSELKLIGMILGFLKRFGHLRVKLRNPLKNVIP